ncbi:MAG: hypothetical protein PHI37_01680 [Candidatus Gracilibacteria bacterium]|nr:hypothetical protein [Candidatus Gracilibacteria bacterium]
MIDNKKWLKFELNSEIASTEQFEIGFCREFFSIEQGLNIDDVTIIDGLKGIENIPVNGVAFQSKYFKDDWKWSKIKESLDKILKAKQKGEKPFDELNKIYVYVKRIKGSTYLNDSIIDDLKNIGVEVVIYEKWEKIDLEYKYEKLRGYFTVKQDIEYELKLIEKYIDNLYLEPAEELLNIIDSKIEDLSDLHKYKYYILKGKLKTHINLFQEKIEKKDYYKNFLKAYEFKQDKKAKINKAIGLYNLERKDEALEIIKDILDNTEYDEYAYSVYLSIESEKYDNIEDFEKNIDKKYLKDEYVRDAIFDVYRLKGEIILGFEKYYKKEDCEGIEQLKDKILYFINWSEYLQKKYGIYNLSIVAKNEFIKLENFLDSFRFDIEGKKLVVEADIFNIKGIINSQIFNNFKTSSQYFARAYERRESSVIKLNEAFSLINENTIESKNEAIDILDVIVKNFDEILKKEKDNPNKNVLFQAHIKLADLSYDKGQIPKGKAILKIFEDKYLQQVKKFYKRQFYSVKFKFIDINSKQHYISELLSSDNCIVYNLLGYIAFNNDVKYLEEGYKIYKSNHKEHFNDIIQLAEFYLKKGEKIRFFEIVDNELKDLSDIFLFQNYIIIGIELGEIEKVEKKLEDYINHNDGKDDFISIRFKSYLEEKRGEYKKAISIITDFLDEEYNIDLAIRKAYLELDLGDNVSFEKTIKELINLYNDLDFHNKIGVIDLYKLIDRKETIQYLYDLLQNDVEDEKYELQLKQLYIRLLIPLKKEVFEIENIDENSYIIIEEQISKNKKTLLLDGYSNNKNVDLVKSKDTNQYNLLIGHKKGDIVKDLFPTTTGIVKEYKILEIKSKYIHLLQEFYKNPEEIEMESIYIPNGDDFTEFQKMGKRIGKEEEDRKKYINENFYNKGTLSFGVLKHFYHKSYIDLYYGMLGKDYNIISDLTFKSDKYREVENIVVDISSILTIFELGLQDILTNNFKVYIPQSTLTYFNRELTELKFNWELNDNTTIVFDSEGRGSIINLDNDYKQKRKDFFESIINWLKEKCIIKSSNLLVSKDKNINKFLGIEFYESLLIAQDNNYILFSDDLLSRNLFRSEIYKMEAFGTESFISILLSKKLISIDNYNEHIIKLCKMNFSNLTMNIYMFGYLFLKERYVEVEELIKYSKNKGIKEDFIVNSLIHIITSLPFGLNILYKVFCNYFEIIIKYYDYNDVKKECLNILSEFKQEDNMLKFAKLVDIYLIKH